MKEIKLNGVTYISPVYGSHDKWYYGLDKPNGDLFEEEELYRYNEHVKGDILYFISYPRGNVRRVAERKEFVGYSSPVFENGRLYYLRVRFKDELIELCSIDPASWQEETVTVLEMGSCYNLAVCEGPVTVSRQTVGEKLEIMWPEERSFNLGEHESFYMRDGNELYVSRWHEDDNGYWEETLVLDVNTGEVLRNLMGDVRRMPDGSLWHVS